MKITIIGGGSTYTPELVSGLLERQPELQLDELWLMDIDDQRLQIVGGLAQRMIRAAGDPFEIKLTDDRQAALSNADYVITQLRVGQMPARQADEYLGQRHGLIGQETTGVGGMAKALRTIPVILSIARDVAALAPNALLLNFTNPAGLITEALSQHAPQVQAIGVCNVAINMKMTILKAFNAIRGTEYGLDDIRLDTLGLNHLSWHRGCSIRDHDIWPEVWSMFRQKVQAEPEEHPFNLDEIDLLGMIPNYYLEYYYHTQRKLADQQKWPPSRAEEVMALEKELLQDYADPQRITPPEKLMQRGGAYYSTLATRLIADHAADSGMIHEINVRHAGAVPGWPVDWVLEMPCRIWRDRIEPLPAEPLPEVFTGLISAVKAYERLTVQAAIDGDRNRAAQALLAHPLGPDIAQVESILTDLLETNRPFLPQFFNEE